MWSASIMWCNIMHFFFIFIRLYSTECVLLSEWWTMEFVRQYKGVDCEWVKMHILTSRNKITVFIIVNACKTARTHLLIWFMYMTAYISKWFVKHFSKCTHTHTHTSSVFIIPYALFFVHSFILACAGNNNSFTPVTSLIVVNINMGMVIEQNYARKTREIAQW